MHDRQGQRKVARRRHTLNRSGALLMAAKGGLPFGGKAKIIMLSNFCILWAMFMILKLKFKFSFKSCLLRRLVRAAGNFLFARPFSSPFLLYFSLLPLSFLLALPVGHAFVRSFVSCLLFRNDESAVSLPTEWTIMRRKSKR